MTNYTASLEYRRAATQQASVVGLVIALHDTLTGNLRRAADAIDRGDIQRRCDELVHAFNVLQQLEAMLDMQQGGQTAINIKRFYSHVRGQILIAQFKLSSEMLRKQVEIVFDVRGAWQQLDSPAIDGQNTETLGHVTTHSTPDHTLPTAPRLSFSCSF